MYTIFTILISIIKLTVTDLNHAELNEMLQKKLQDGCSVTEAKQLLENTDGKKRFSIRKCGRSKDQENIRSPKTIHDHLQNCKIAQHLVNPLPPPPHRQKE